MADAKKPKMRLRSLMLHGPDLSYVREILTGDQWQRHDNEVFTKDDAEKLAKDSKWKIVDETASAFESKAGIRTEPEPEPAPVDPAPLTPD